MIYLDYNATTPVDPTVLQRMLPYFSEHFGNPSSAGHAKGWTAEAAVNRAVDQVVSLLGGHSEDFVLTSGATEAINYAIKGIAQTHPKGSHLITLATEHKAVLDCYASLESDGYSTTILDVDSDGLINLDELKAAIRNDTILVATMWGNNEIGTIQPIEAISTIVRPLGVPLMVDATQAVGKIPVSVEGIDLLACSAHKFYGPKGVGALYTRRGRDGVRLRRLVDGGGQQRSRRGGTLNVPAIVGMGEAAAICAGKVASDYERLSTLRNRFEAIVLSECETAVVNAANAERLPQTSSITFRGASTTDMLLRLRELAVSTASACATGAGGPSHVLTAIGLSPADAESTFRVSLGRPTTDEEVERAAGLFVDAYAAVRLTRATPTAQT
jgi:cysteine desulfurase